MRHVKSYCKPAGILKPSPTECISLAQAPARCPCCRPGRRGRSINVRQGASTLDSCPKTWGPEEALPASHTSYSVLFLFLSFPSLVCLEAGELARSHLEDLRGPLGLGVTATGRLREVTYCTVAEIQTKTCLAVVQLERNLRMDRCAHDPNLRCAALWG